MGFWDSDRIKYGSIVMHSRGETRRNRLTFRSDTKEAMHKYSSQSKRTNHGENNAIKGRFKWSGKGWVLIFVTPRCFGFLWFDDTRMPDEVVGLWSA